VYGWIWRRLPGGPAARAALALALLLALSALLLFVVFPWIEPHLPLEAVTLEH
jgi:hypothetical protein